MPTGQVASAGRGLRAYPISTLRSQGGRADNFYELRCCPCGYCLYRSAGATLKYMEPIPWGEGGIHGTLSERVERRFERREDRRGGQGEAKGTMAIWRAFTLP